MDLKKCPKCKSTYYGYPALSRVDDRTEICPSCGSAEAIAIAVSGKRQLDLKIDDLTELEIFIKEKIARIEMQNLETRRKQHSERVKLGKKAKKQATI